jgi:HAD superfamily hydrolase (TIGR01509 family)
MTSNEYAPQNLRQPRLAGPAGYDEPQTDHGIRERLVELLGFDPEAVIFDMDGVLADTEPVNQRALTAVLANRGAELRAEEYGHLIGLSNQASWDWLIARFALETTAATLADEYVRDLVPRVRKDVDAGPGVLELVSGLRANGISLGLASASPRGAVDAVLAKLGLNDAFSVVVCDSDVKAGKPAPDLFLLAAARLGADPANCLVIEDSLHGIEAARAAGIPAVALRTRYTADSVLDARIVVDSLECLLPRTASRSL